MEKFEKEKTHRLNKKKNNIVAFFQESKQMVAMTQLINDAHSATIKSIPMPITITTRTDVAHKGVQFPLNSAF